MLSKFEKQVVRNCVEQDLLDVYTRANNLGVHLHLIENPLGSILVVCDADCDNPFLEPVHRALNCFTGSFRVMQKLIDCRNTDFVRDFCKCHGFELV